MSARPATLLDPDSATLAGTAQADGRFDVEAVREQFPILTVRPDGKPLAYLDSAATSQKPQVVIDAMAQFFSRDNANVHRGVHYLSERATEAYEGARVKAQGFLNATEVEEIVFTRGTTEGLNLVAATYGAAHLGEGDEVLITERPRTSMTSSPTAPTRSQRSPGTAWSVLPRPNRPSSPLSSTACTPTTSAPSSIARVLLSAPATTAPSRSSAGSGSPPPPAHRLPATARALISTRLPPGYSDEYRRPSDEQRPR